MGSPLQQFSPIDEISLRNQKKVLESEDEIKRRLKKDMIMFNTFIFLMLLIATMTAVYTVCTSNHCDASTLYNLVSMGKNTVNQMWIGSLKALGRGNHTDNNNS